jgi:hypothetical protein
METPKKTEKLEKETIVAAALKIDGDLYTGINHPVIISEIQKDNPDFKLTDTTSLEDGFMTNTGRFVDREEATKIASEADQIVKAPHDKGGELEPWKEGLPLDSWDLKNLNYDE